MKKAPVPDPKSFILVFFVTGRCNMACPHCFAERSPRTMPAAVGRKAVDFAVAEAERLGLRSILISMLGGEPLLAFRTMAGIARYARKKTAGRFDSLNFQFCTNATLFSDRLVREAAGLKLFPVLSLNGPRDVHDAGRRDGKGGTWDRVMNSVEIFTRHSRLLHRGNTDRCVEFRVTFTPATLPRLYDSVKFISDLPLMSRSYIVLMPAMADNDLWVGENRRRTSALLRSEMTRIGRLIADLKRKGRTLKVGINECLSPGAFLDPNTESSREAAAEGPACGCGGRHLAVDISGNLYPCHLAASRESSSSGLVIGDVWKGITKPGIAARFSGTGKNPCFSCRYWNSRTAGGGDTAHWMYRALHRAWQAALAEIELRRLSGPGAGRRAK